MKERLFLFIFAAMAIKGFSAPFNNLGFDEYDQSSSFMPGWQLFNPQVPPTLNVTNNDTVGWLVGLNKFYLGIFDATLYDASGRKTQYGNMTYAPPEGNYALALWTANFLTPEGGIEHIPWTITQVGDIPPDAKTIRYHNDGQPFELRINDTLIPIASIAYANPRQVYGDISAFAGQTVELKFSTIYVGFTNPFYIAPGYWTLDGIIFSSQIIPEPSTWVLLGFGSSILIFSRRHFRRPSQGRPLTRRVR